MMTEEEIRLRALELAVELRKRTPGVSGAATVVTAKKFINFIQTGRVQ